MNDILLTDGEPAMDATGDWQVGYSHEQHQWLLLLTPQGSWKENPDVGVGAYRFLEAEGPDRLLREVRQQYNADGMDVKRIDYNEATGKLVIDANYGTI